MVDLIPTRCALCGASDNATELYPANFTMDAFNPAVFSARRLPDRIHYRIVRCRNDGLVRSDPVASPEDLARLYRESAFTYGEQVAGLRRTYGRYLKKVGAAGPGSALLEIGCGNGFFLEEALVQGYTRVCGIEPSEDAASQVPPAVRGCIRREMLHPGLLEPEQFDVVCAFQVFDHLADPGTMLDEIWRLLIPGGAMLCFNHNVEALTARLLRERSPIIDIEHTYLYSPRTMRAMAEAHGFAVEQCGVAFNRHSLRYLARLLPLPRPLARGVRAALGAASFGGRHLSLPLGNMYLIARKGGQRHGT